MGIRMTFSSVKLPLNNGKINDQNFILEIEALHPLTTYPKFAKIGLVLCP